MAGMNVLALASVTMTNAFTRFENGAVKFRDGVSGNGDANPAEGAVEMIEAKAQLTAGVQIARVADEMLGELLNIQAKR